MNHPNQHTVGLHNNMPPLAGPLLPNLPCLPLTHAANPLAEKAAMIYPNSLAERHHLATYQSPLVNPPVPFLPPFGSDISPNQSSLRNSNSLMPLNSLQSSSNSIMQVPTTSKE